MTNRRNPIARRAPRDAYYTPDPVALGCARLIARHIRPATPAVVVEPSVGGGAWVRAVGEVWPDARTVTNDLDPAAEAHHHGDWLDESHRYTVMLGARWTPRHPTGLDPQPGPVAIVGNPPYHDVADQIRATVDAIRDCPGGSWCAMLLPLPVVGQSEDRATLWRAGYTPHAMICLSRRPSFVSVATGIGRHSSSDYAIYHWGRAARVPTDPIAATIGDWRTP